MAYNMVKGGRRGMYVVVYKCESTSYVKHHFTRNTSILE